MRTSVRCSSITTSSMRPTWYVKSMTGKMVRLSIPFLLPGQAALSRGLQGEPPRAARGRRLSLGSTSMCFVRSGRQTGLWAVAGSLDEPWLMEYRGVMPQGRSMRRAITGLGSGPTSYELIPAGPWAGPATPLDGLSADGAALYARELLLATEARPQPVGR